MERCIIHGWAHWPGETDSVDTVGDDLDCRTEEWPDVVPGTVTSSQCEPVEQVPADQVGYYVLATGDLAYIDTFGDAGLVPCKVTAVAPTEVTVRITAGRPGWERGEVLAFRVPNLSIVKRSQVFRQSGQYLIDGRLRFYTDEGDLL